MLVFVSDLHITDGSTARNVDAAAFTDILGPEIISAAAKRKATDIKVVLLGDIFDLVRTDYWFRNNIPMQNRPWGGTLDPETAMNTDEAGIVQQYRAILQSILSTGAAKGLQDMIRDICTVTGKTVTVVYVIGNHDRVLNNFRSLRDDVTSYFSKVPGVQVEFKNVLDEPEYGVIARHGHEWDENCHGWKFYNAVLKPHNQIGRFDTKVYQVQALGEVITSELMAGIVYRVAQGTHSPALVDAVKDVNNIRPMLDVFLWLDWIGRCQKPEDQNILVGALKESIIGVLASSLARRWDDLEQEVWYFSGDLTDRLEQILNFIGNRSFSSLKSVMPAAKFFQGLLSSSKDDFVEGAKQEWHDGLSPKYQYVLYGHTHQARMDSFCGRPDGTVQMYINTGTYLPLIRQTDTRQGFFSANQMTMAFFYRADESAGIGRRNGPMMDLWNGIRRTPGI